IDWAADRIVAKDRCNSEAINESGWSWRLGLSRTKPPVAKERQAVLAESKPHSRYSSKLISARLLLITPRRSASGSIKDGLMNKDCNADLKTSTAIPDGPPWRCCWRWPQRSVLRCR